MNESIKNKITEHKDAYTDMYCTLIYCVHIKRIQDENLPAVKDIREIIEGKKYPSITKIDNAVRCGAINYRELCDKTTTTKMCTEELMNG